MALAGTSHPKSAAWWTPKDTNRPGTSPSSMPLRAGCPGEVAPHGVRWLRADRPGGVGLDGLGCPRWVTAMLGQQGGQEARPARVEAVGQGGVDLGSSPGEQVGVVLERETSAVESAAHQTSSGCQGVSGPNSRRSTMLSGCSRSHSPRASPQVRGTSSRKNPRRVQPGCGGPAAAEGVAGPHVEQLVGHHSSWSGARYGKSSGRSPESG
jgi:hypothetical protein